MGWQLKSTTLVKGVKQRDIDSFRNVPQLPGDRAFNQARADYLLKCHKLDRLRPMVWSLVYVEDCSKVFRLNGNHTSHVLSGLNGTLGEQTVYLEKYDADTLRDAADLFSTFDRTESSRSAQDVNGAVAAAVPGLEGIGKQVISSAVSGLSFNKSGPWYAGRTDKDERAKTIDSNVKAIQWLSRIIGGKRTQPLKKVPVVAAILKTGQQDWDVAEEFWSSVRSGSASTSNPTRVLHDFLLSHKLGSRKHGAENAGVAAFYNKCITHWNRWNKKRGTGHLVLPFIAEEKPAAKSKRKS